MIKKTNRVKTGIKGLDELISGGLPLGSSVLITGSAGSGKTTFGMQYIYYGAKDYKEPGIFISLEEDPDRMIFNFKNMFDWNLRKLIQEKKILIMRTELYDFEKMKTMIEDLVDKFNAQRLVIDPTTILGLYFEKEFQVRRSLLELDRLLKKLSCTTLMTNDIPEGHKGLSSFGIQEFTSDGIIVLYYTKEGNIFTRALTVRKMRTTKHDTGIHPIEITKKGMVVYPTEQLI